MVHLFFYKTCATEVFLVKLRCFYRVYEQEILAFLYPLLSLKTRSSTHPTVGARMLPPKLYLVVLLSSELGELDKDNLFGLQKDLWKYVWEVCVVLYHMFIPHEGIVINVLA